ncbi:hypothetical protein L207DRAFT_505187 [Hyaloscypha variabilis F]|uniref:Uncharacterized protein n=1 Tax=Hyaloscypha variabilis (strain UAMH 11265 / GT02V1 / F) TaxID=1149755 RepID=A0A2J6SBK6_HYAVF|nr:hypothetical protein L207DRAFT_505187 [Hyaloscypha variabilis F]
MHPESALRSALRYLNNTSKSSFELLLPPFPNASQLTRTVHGAMSVGFGFSVGDFIAAIELVGTVTDALRSSGQAGAEYRELLHQLLSLESALIQVKRLEVGEGLYEEIIALRQAAAECGRTIDAFWERTRKYQPALGGTRSGSRIRDGWMKIRWAVCRKEDVARFKADLVGHTESIQLLLTTMQLRETRINDQKQHDSQTTLAGRVQEGYFSCMQRLLVVVGQGKQTLDMISSILRTNVKVFQIVLQIQQMITRIPGQVDRQQPVYMIDALGRTSPFHLEFVRSAEALVAVLKVNFKKHGDAAKKIENGDFAIEDAATKRDIDLTADWDICFAPGQRVVMSIILTRAVPISICPKCNTRHLNWRRLFDCVDVECLSCGLTYRNTVGLDIGTETLSGQAPRTSNTNSMDSATSERVGPSSKPLKRKLEGDDLGDLRRVRFRRLPPTVVKPIPSPPKQRHVRAIQTARDVTPP